MATPSRCCIAAALSTRPAEVGNPDMLRNKKPAQIIDPGGLSRDELTCSRLLLDHNLGALAGADALIEIDDVLVHQANAAR